MVVSLLQLSDSVTRTHAVSEVYGVLEIGNQDESRSLACLIEQRGQNLLTLIQAECGLQSRSPPLY